MATPTLPWAAVAARTICARSRSSVASEADGRAAAVKPITITAIERETRRTPFVRCITAPRNRRDRDAILTDLFAAKRLAPSGPRDTGHLRVSVAPWLLTL